MRRSLGIEQKATGPLFYLVVALVWLLLGLFILLFPEQMPRQLRVIPYTELSVAWVCFLLFAWRMVGWWQWRERQRRKLLQGLETGRRAHISDEYHPEFDFQDPESEKNKPSP